MVLKVLPLVQLEEYSSSVCLSRSSQETLGNSLYHLVPAAGGRTIRRKLQTTGRRGFDALCIDEVVRKKKVDMCRDRLRKKN